MNEVAATLALITALRSNAGLAAMVGHKTGDIRIAASFPETGQKETQVSVAATRTTPLNVDQAPVFRTNFQICITAKARLKCKQISDAIGTLLVPSDSRTYFNFTGSGIINRETQFISTDDIEYHKDGDKYETSLYCLAIWSEGTCP